MRKGDRGCSDHRKSSAGTVSPPFHTAGQTGVTFTQDNLAQDAQKNFVGQYIVGAYSYILDYLIVL